MEERSAQYHEEEADSEDLLLVCQRVGTAARMRQGSRTKESPMIVLMPAMARVEAVYGEEVR